MTTAADMVDLIAPQLASPGGTPTEAALQDPRMAYEVKWDGIRALIVLDEAGKVTILNRRLRDITFRYPDIVVQVEASFTTPIVLDGEIVAYGSDGKPSFALAAQRDAVTKPAAVAVKVANIPVTFMAFDCLHSNSVDLRQQPWQTRRSVLERRLEFESSNSLLQLVPVYGTGDAIWDAVRELGLEGVIAKNIRAPYTQRRTKDWLKYKTTQRLSCVVTSYEEGEGHRAGTVGAVHLDLFDAVTGQLVRVGKAGSGFTDATCREVQGYLDAGVPLIVEIECLNRSKDNILRFPIFKGIRSDVGPDACTTTQLDLLPTT